MGKPVLELGGLNDMIGNCVVETGKRKPSGLVSSEQIVTIDIKSGAEAEAGVEC